MNALALALVHEVVHFETRLAAPANQRVHRGVVVHLVKRLLVRAFDHGKLRIHDDRTASDAVVGFLRTFLFTLAGLDRHAVDVEHEGFVGFPDEGNLLRLQLVLDRDIGHMALSGCSKRAIENNHVVVDSSVV